MTAGLSPEELARAKAYMRLENEDEDGVVLGAVLSARSYLEGAGVRLPTPGSSRRVLYDTVAHALALAVYEHRDPVIVGSAVSANPVLRQMINQLKLTEPPVSNLDTGGNEGEEGHGGEDP